jgi:hypothetical protein
MEPCRHPRVSSGSATTSASRTIPRCARASTAASP